MADGNGINSILWSFFIGFVIPFFAVYIVRTLLLSMFVFLEVVYNKGYAFAGTMNSMFDQSDREL